MDDHHFLSETRVNQRGYMLRKKGFLSTKFLGMVLITAFILTLSACDLARVVPTPTVTSTTVKILIPPTKVAPTIDVEATSLAEQATQTHQSEQATQEVSVQEMEATQTSAKTTDDASQSATATAIAPILEELPVYNASPSFGYAAEVYQPITITVDGYHASKSSNTSDSLSVKDFLVAADITWDSEYGEAGCGFSFRSDGGKDAPNEYRVILSRISGGKIYFYALTNGKIANYRIFYAIPYDTAFSWARDSTNRLTLGVKGNTVYIFSNKVWVGAVDITEPPPDQPDLPVAPEKPVPPGSDLTGKELQEAKSAYKSAMEQYQEAYDKYLEEKANAYADYNAVLSAYLSNDTVYDEGSIGMLAYATTGSVTCQFSNGWLWVLE